MSIPDPYRQGQAPQGNPPSQGPYGQPYPQQAYPQNTYPPQAGYPQQSTHPQVAQPQAPQSDFQQQAYQATPIRAVQPVQAVPVQPVPVQPQYAQPVQSVQPVATGPRPIAVGSTEAAEFLAKKTPAAATGGVRPVLVKKSEQDALKVEDRPDEDAEEKPPEVVKAAPPWLVSLVVHMVGLIILGLLYFGMPQQPMMVEVRWAERLGEQLDDSSVLMSSSEPVETLDTEWSKELQMVEDPLAAPPELEIDPLIAGTTATSNISAPSIGMALSGREKGAKTALLAAYGGTKLTEEAVRDGLLWLKKNQQKDGSWSLAGPYGEGSTQENATSATAMALLAFQGAGNTHRSGEFKDQVANGWKWLLAKQDADGNFVQEAIYNSTLYTQAQCTIAVCELYGMTKDEKYRKPAQLAIDYAISAQDPVLGGWRYTPRQDSDLSVTGWFVMGLQSALMAGLEVPSPELDSISKFLDAAQHNGGSQYSYKAGQGPTLPMTAEGLLCRQYLGWKHEDERLRGGVNYLLQNKLDYNDQNVYYWYYATQVLHHMGHQDWDQWNAVMREAVPRAQTKTGKEAGSWSPGNDRWGSRGGRLYVTCLSIYMLEVYYRHLPIYQHQIQ
jgi:hypothetical protein